MTRELSVLIGLALVTVWLAFRIRRRDTTVPESDPHSEESRPPHRAATIEPDPGPDLGDGAEPQGGASSEPQEDTSPEVAQETSTGKPNSEEANGGPLSKDTTPRSAASDDDLRRKVENLEVPLIRFLIEAAEEILNGIRVQLNTEDIDASERLGLIRNRNMHERRIRLFRDVLDKRLRDQPPAHKAPPDKRKRGKPYGRRRHKARGETEHHCPSCHLLVKKAQFVHKWSDEPECASFIPMAPCPLIDILFGE